MSQRFDLRLATETLAEDAQQLGVTVETLQNISVQVTATLVKQPNAYLELEYFVTLPTESLDTQFNWPKWQSEQVGFTDYLWEQTCLEYFFTGKLIVNDRSINSDCLINNDNTANTHETTAYVEINASPDGRYAMYQFKSYRNPATLPPKPLLQADGQTRASIDWIDTSNQQMPLVETKASSQLSTTSKSSAPKNISPKLYHYERSFRVPLNQLSNETVGIKNTAIEYMHPCVILYFGNTALYFAPKHASPPDFHDRHYWSRFNHKSTLIK
ncbi:hypothetical protein [Psychrobacter sp. DAB_AL32B]|uniref:hypothetical protein n=1 Tax=Psychrobacter sp. DAB_AL32B TaxID=1028414 RepID=UPI000B7CAE2B|nr:hypothetical protein [Psychrobacter sp. DAB_AL32B]OXL27162.1 hypothetical protein CAN34_02245 [Psychrobacter sp. DAB_AL32B]